ncbi:MAG: citramalate synthase [Chloroflexi bacterium]|nr:citramalate synthase [Chloroflexota bacterium]
MAGQLEIYDTTLRDGTQQEGISLSVDDKLAIAARLDALGVHYIEGGFAGANPKDDEFFKRAQSLDLKNAVLAAFGSTRRADGRVEDDAAIVALLRAETPLVTIVGKASAWQVRNIIGTSIEENLHMVADSVSHLVAQGRRAVFDAEHFFDGYKLDPDYALQTLRVAAEAGAETVVLCDTNGGTLPDEASKIVAAACEFTAPLGVRIGIHAHNDTDTAVAVSMAAWLAGASQIQGCINGYGERTGNANLTSIIANLKLKLGVDVISDEQLATLTDTSVFIAETLNMSPHAFQPYVGASAFAHKGGLHAAAVNKRRESYEHVQPGTVGNRNAVVVSELSGRGNVMRRIRDLGLEEELTDDDVRGIVQLLKEQENRGFSYEGAAASFELLIRRYLPNYEAPFELVDFMVLVENRRTARLSETAQPGRSPSGGVLSEATIKVRIGEEVLHTAAEGNGPVNALDHAMRKAVLQSYPELECVRLIDYKVRVVAEGTGTGAIVRVVIESSDGHETWSTVGSSENILEASWLALADSMEYWLVCRRPESPSGEGTGAGSNAS